MDPQIILIPVHTAASATLAQTGNANSAVSGSNAGSDQTAETENQQLSDPNSANNQGGNNTGGGGGLGPFLPFLVIIILMMVVMSIFSGRAQKKQQRQRQEFLESLKRQDRVVTRGGVIGTITEIRGDEVILKVDHNNPQARLTFAKSAVDSVIRESAATDADTDDTADDDDADNPYAAERQPAASGV